MTRHPQAQQLERKCTWSRIRSVSKNFQLHNFTHRFRCGMDQVGWPKWKERQLHQGPDARWLVWHEHQNRLLLPPGWTRHKCHHPPHRLPLRPTEVKHPSMSACQRDESQEWILPLGLWRLVPRKQGWWLSTLRFYWKEYQTCLLLLLSIMCGSHNMIIHWDCWGRNDFKKKIICCRQLYWFIN